MASTRLDLDKLVQDGAFREDLYYRLVVSRVELPPLRTRGHDICELAKHFWRELGGEGEPGSPLLAQLARHPWPGNIRELKNRIARIVAFGAHDEIIVEPSPAEIVPETQRSASQPPPESPTTTLFEKVLEKDLPLARARELVVGEFEKAYVERVLAQVHQQHVDHGVCLVDH